jgi:signal transduction histidine kinase
MAVSTVTNDLLEEGTLSFSIESRILRELGERLVKEPEVALLELVKNSYDADSKVCEIEISADQVRVEDDGHGMTFDEFEGAWMRIGTGSKQARRLSRTYNRTITGEKGIGRFAVRFLGKALRLESVAFDLARGFQTLLVADFNWPAFDSAQDLGKVKIPYRLLRAPGNRVTGTRLVIGKLRQSPAAINLRSVRTGSIGVVSPYRALLRPSNGHAPVRNKKQGFEPDPGFELKIQQTAGDSAEDGNVARAVLNNFILRAVLELKGERLELSVFRKSEETPTIKIVDRFRNAISPVYADIRFFPHRKGTFAGLSIPGKVLKDWVKEHSGVAVFDRTFRVHPYGTASDDWLSLAADTARRAREPRSSLAIKHLPMDQPTRMSTQLNYMLRLPYPQQLVGIVQVEGRRSQDESDADTGLIPAADREGFLNNSAFQQLFDIVRGAVEAIAAADRELQQEAEEAEQERLLRSLRADSRQAIKEIEANPNIARTEKARIVRQIAQTRALAEAYEERTKQRETTLEVVSLLGIVAGFMTHEFGTVMHELAQAQHLLDKLARKDVDLKGAAEALAAHHANLNDFVTYAQGYIRGASSLPQHPYPSRPRIQQVVRVFGKYATERGIAIAIEIGPDVMAPLVPVSLYNGIALNLYTNALKAVTAKAGGGDRRITFRAWNEQQWHFLEVSDTGIGIPTTWRERIFDPLFTTTSTNQDPLGSGMGLGLALVKRGVETYGGRADVVDPPPGFTTCVRVRFGLGEAP